MRKKIAECKSKGGVHRSAFNVRRAWGSVLQNRNDGFPKIENAWGWETT
jgi:hypothetical protein